MNKKILFTIAISIILIAVSFFLYYFYPLEMNSWLEVGSSEIRILQEGKGEVVSLEPVFKDEEISWSNLTKAGIFMWTNVQREEYGMSSFSQNQKLDEAAMEKLDDMFEKEYFAHISPSGVGIGDLVTDISYEFILVGENLAVGRFKNDEDVVSAWMESLGHRENILDSRYEEIGIATRKDFFMGQETWIAVQVFGMPSSACPEIDNTLVEEIENRQEEADSLQNDIWEKKDEIGRIRPKWSEQYIKKVEEYNLLVEGYNELIEALQILIDEYNQQVKLKNDCIEVQ